ncbi:M81 family metallopeptidase [Phenylobacterium sp.]|uniref:M81 family metallopeptidase n=1 Tax=Phenylobacterium sp. TaxID=1871053 RepID=UPI002FC5D0B7
MYVAVLAHESNSFSPLPTDLESYRDMLVFRPDTGEGAERLKQFEDIAPLASLSEARGHEVVRGVWAAATPSGPTVRSTYEGLRDAILAGLAAAAPVDAVLLFLHGAQMAEGYDDCEGDLLVRVRELVGPETFVGVLLDLHCNVTPAMVSAANALVPCKEYPHIDWPERSAELVEMAEGAVRGEIRPVTVFQPVPMLGFYHTTREPLRSFVDELTALEGKDKVLAANLAHGFPFSDQAYTGAGVILVMDGEDVGGRQTAEGLGRRFFAMREAVDASHPDIHEALDRVEALVAQGGGPVVLADTSDNPGGGAPGDSTFVLDEVFKRGMTGVAVAPLWDPEAVKIAFRAGLGARLAMRIGGKLGPLSGDPLDLDVVVRALNPDAQQETFSQQRDSLGPCAAVETDSGVTIVLCTVRQQTFSPDCFTELAIDPASQRVLIVKSAQHFHAKFAPIAREIVYCRGPGYMDSDYARLPLTKVQRPIWPLDAAPFEAHGITWG